MGAITCLSQFDVIFTYTVRLSPPKRLIQIIFYFHLFYL